MTLMTARRAGLLACFVGSLLAIGGCDPGSGATPRRDAGPHDGSSGGGADADGDGISDGDEGRLASTDTDADGTPDYLDDDSDADGIGDAVEAGDAMSATPPADSDMDGQPDFQDIDADGNGVLDETEGVGDTDGDHIPDFRDRDDDADFASDLEEVGPDASAPLDTDHDGTPDYRDVDSDGDTISDIAEQGPDTDRDGTDDIRDTDSDDDGLTDSVEAGDADLATAPFDTDMDAIPDYRDPDSDGDGISDHDEVAAGSSPVRADSDGDGISDLIEIGAGTDPNDATDNPRTRGDFVFVVPYEMDPMPPRDTLEFSTSIQFADVYFLFDITTSMDGEIAALRGAVSTVMADLACLDSHTACMADTDCASGQVCSSFTSTCIEDPAVSGCLLSTYTGTGYYETNYVNVVSLQPDPAATSGALNINTFGGTENLYRALWGLADPAAAPGETGCTGPGAGTIGCPAFRSEAVRIAVVFTDEDSDGSESVLTAAGALASAGITLIGVWSGTPAAATRAELVDVVNTSGSLSSTGTPLVFDGQNASVVPAVVAAINEVVRGVPLRVTIEATDEPGDAGDALPFIDYLEINGSGGNCTSVTPLEDTNGDSRFDAFPALRPGTPVCWDVVAARNTTVMPALTPQIFRARLTVRGDGSPLDSRIVYFLVPPRIEVPGGPG